MQCSESTTIKLTYIFSLCTLSPFSLNAWANENERGSKALIEPITLNPPPSPVLNCEEPGERVRERTTLAELCSSFRVIKYANYYSSSSSLVPPPPSSFSTGEDDGWINTISLDGGDKADWLTRWLTAPTLVEHSRAEGNGKGKGSWKKQKGKMYHAASEHCYYYLGKNIFLPLIYVALIPSHEFCRVSLPSPYATLNGVLVCRCRCRDVCLCWHMCAGYTSKCVWVGPSFFSCNIL